MIDGRRFTVGFHRLIRCYLTAFVDGFSPEPLSCVPAMERSWRQLLRLSDLTIEPIAILEHGVD